MAEKHPYASPGAVSAAVGHFRKSFPAKVSADTLRKLGIAPNNESYVINTLRFIGVIDAEGNKTDKSTSAFSQHELSAFQQAFGEMVKSAYTELFALHGDATWELPFDSLITFFRTNDQTSDAVGRKQASIFQILASLSGHGEAPVTPKATAKPKEAKPKAAKAKVTTPAAISENKASVKDHNDHGNVGLTVRIEVNLPAAADQETYDRIFRSIRENLLNGR